MSVSGISYSSFSNRTTKINADYFKAFNSYNYPILAEAGMHIHYRRDLMHRPMRNSKPKFHHSLNSNVAIIRLFLGISAEMLPAMICIPHLKAIVLETYGAGNAPRIFMRLCIIWLFYANFVIK